MNYNRFYKFSSKQWVHYLPHTLIINAYVSILEFYIIKPDVETVIAFSFSKC